MVNHKKQFCPKNHDTNIVGRIHGQCYECRKNYQRLYNQRPEQKEAVKKWSSVNKDHRKNRVYQRIYGITLADYWRMYKEQDGHCAICTKQMSLVVDHNHQTGRVRGLLCGSCNRGIGYLGDDPIRLQRASEYLKQFSTFGGETRTDAIGV
jgi:hypothetical protein